MKQTHLKTLSARIDELEQLRILNGLSFEEFTRLALDANKQSKTIVTLAHFVPCDANGVPLEKPKKYFACNAREAAEILDYTKAQKSVIFEGWEVASEKEVINKNGDRLCFFGSRVFYDIHIGNQEYQGNYLKDNPTLADLADATTKNPLKLK